MPIVILLSIAVVVLLASCGAPMLVILGAWGVGIVLTVLVGKKTK